MKNTAIIPCLTVTYLLLVTLGCNDLGIQLSKILPENGGTSIGNGQLNPAGDASAIDAGKIGGGNSSMARPGAKDTDGNNAFGDASMNGDYAGMIENMGENMGMEGNSGDGAMMDAGDEQQMLQSLDPAGGINGGGGLDADLNTQQGMLNLPDIGGEEGSLGYLDSLGAPGAMGPPQMGNYDSQQSLGDFGPGMEKPSDGRGPQKQRPSKRPENGASNRPSSKTKIPNINDRPAKSTGNKPFGQPNNSPKPAMPANLQKEPTVVFRMPGKLPNPVYDLINTVAVPLLLENGTGMSFSTEMLKQRDLTAQGTVYWVVHSERLGFSTTPVPPAGGRFAVAVAKFTPTSGPFKAFVVVVGTDGKVTYLASSVDVK